MDQQPIPTLIPAPAKPNFLIPILILLTFLSVSASIFLYYQNQAFKKQLAQIQTTPSPSEVLAKEETANQVPDGNLTSWKTYTNTTYGYSINYPDNWRLTEVDDPGLGDEPLMYTTIVSRLVPLKDSGFVNISIARELDWNQSKKEAKQRELVDYNFNGIPALIFDKDGYDKSISFNSTADNLITITYGYAPNNVDKLLISQILSTFRFTN